MAAKSTKKVVTIGGGTGSYTILSGLKLFSHLDLTAIVTMADNGGSTGKLRDELGVLPPGDARQCLVALSESPEILRELFNYRFGGGDLKGHNFGNLFVSALEKITGSFEEALDTASSVLSIRGKVLPVTTTSVNLQLTLLNGETIHGENEIAANEQLSQVGVQTIALVPQPQANPRAIQAILEADMVVIGPGNFYCSLLPNLLVPEVRNALKKTSATVLYNVNLISKRGHCNNWHVESYLDELYQYLAPNTIDIALYNTKKPNPGLIDKYIEEGDLVGRSLARETYKGAHLIGADLIADTLFTTSENDLLQRTLIRHDSYKIAQAIVSLL